MTAVFDRAATIKNCLDDALGDTSLGSPARSCVITGGIAWDDCECGQLTVAIVRQYHSASFPQAAATTNATFRQSRCGHAFLVVELSITILRCVPVGGDDDRPPSCEDLAEAAEYTTEDAEAVLNALTCCLRDMYETKDDSGRRLISDFSILDQAYVGPEGMCGGSNVVALIGLANNCACS